MADRTAIDTIKGYFYQFDYSIEVLLLQTDENASIDIEVIEDIDLTTASEKTAIQCKYYSKTEYNHSLIAKPIRFMLDHFKEVKEGRKEKIRYKLFGHFKSGQDKLVLPIDLEFLKSAFLTYSKSEEIEGVKKITKFFYNHEIGITEDKDLEEFISLLEIDINAVEFEKQFKNIISELQSRFKCSHYTAENFFYNSALKIIKELATEADINKRKISKKEFLKRIDTSNIIFNEWFISIKGKKAHLLNLKKEYFTKLNVSPFERFFLIDVNPGDYDRTELKDLIFKISKNWSKVSKREPKPFCPYLFINNLPDSELIELKKELNSEDFCIIDGFDFQGAEFNVNSIIKRPDNNNQIKLKILNSIDYIDNTLNSIIKTKEVYQFYLETEFYKNHNPSIKYVGIQVEKLADIKNII